METQLQDNLETMMGCSLEAIPDSLVLRCGQVEHYIKRVKPYGGLMSTQVLAGIVVGWEQTATVEELDQLREAHHEKICELVEEEGEYNMFKGFRSIEKTENPDAPD